MAFELQRLPQNEEELFWVVKAMWGVTIPRQVVCADHVAPMTAFADAYFGQNSINPEFGVTSIALWHGSRGLSGKSYMLAVLGLTKAVLLGSDVNLLGGSFEQSKNIHVHMRKSWDWEQAPKYMLAKDGATEVVLSNKAVIHPLTASQRTVRGPHPPFLLLDEIDEMDQEILDAALGQPLRQKNYLKQWVKPYTVMCSTWQNPMGTFSEMKRRAEEKNYPVYTWCIASGALVMTARGEIPIEEVTDSDFVLTRKGWRHVQHVTFMGYKPTVELDFGKRKLRLTTDHLVATEDGWRHASALAADTMSPTGTNPSVIGCELVPITAAGGADLVFPSPLLVSTLGNNVEMLDVDASSISTQVIDRKAIWDRTDKFFPNPAMGGDGAVDAFSLFQSIAVSFASWPVNAASGEHGDIVLPVWDIGVEGDDHEFIANGVVVHNCYRETSNPIDGWLTEEAIEEKKASIPKEMWRVEYELGEPSIGNRAFDSDSVERAFSLPFEPEYDEDGDPISGTGYIFKKEGKDYEEYRFERYERDGKYVAGADWAQTQDYTVVAVGRIDVKPFRLVYYARFNRLPYPVMIKKFEDAIAEYDAFAEHDGTGLGAVVHDLMENERARKFVLSGEKRSAMLSEYVAAIENDRWVFPKIKSAYTEHKYAQVGDLYSSSQEYHLPDSVCAFGLMEHVAKRFVGPVIPLNITKNPEFQNRIQKVLDRPIETERMGEVRVVDAGAETDISLFV